MSTQPGNTLLVLKRYLLWKFAQTQWEWNRTTSAPAFIQHAIPLSDNSGPEPPTLTNTTGVLVKVGDSGTHFPSISHLFLTPEVENKQNKNVPQVGISF